MKKQKKTRFIGIVLTGAYMGMKVLAASSREKLEIDADNPYLSASVENGTAREASAYERWIKPELDSTISFCGMVALLPIYAVAVAATYLDDPGPVFFSQKRVGKGKHYFMLHKVRTMKMGTPRDVPTHLLRDPEQYITKVGRWLRAYSIDELPQLWDCFRHRLSLVGPRPALWNQNDLIAEREKYGANDVMPGITGWAQINGRDELSIEDKARFDGEYAAAMRVGGWTAFKMDLYCLFGTFFKVLCHDGVHEGGPDVVMVEKIATAETKKEPAML